MFKNYLIIAWRNIRKNKLYAAINILGLVMGLSVYLFSSLLVTYENTHDLFFENAERTFFVGSVFSPTAEIGVAETDGVYSAVAPFIETSISEIEAVARTIRREFLVSVEDNDYYQRIQFADPAFLAIFDLQYIEGDSRALDDPLGLLIDETTATKLFGSTSAMGRNVTLDHDTILHVTAVVRDLPPNTHLNSDLVGIGRFSILAPLAALKAAADYDLAGNWNNLSMGNLTYILLPPDKSQEWLQAQIDGIYESHVPERSKEFISGFHVWQLVDANTILWDVTGLPIIQAIAMLGLLVLIVAIVNYTNLATAQSLGRAREVGLRKAMGAGQRQLLLQFLIESLTITTISMLISLGILEVAIPLFNTALGKSVSMNYAVVLPWLVGTTIIVGLIAGAYPAHMITKTTPIEALSDGGGTGAKGGLFRSVMLGLQSGISIFMLAIVAVVYLQNAQIESSSNIYPKSQILTLQRLNVESIRDRLDVLRNELKDIPGVTDAAFSSQVPFQQSTWGLSVGPVRGDEAQKIGASTVSIDYDFMKTYDIPLLEGRDLSREVSGDALLDEDGLAVNVIVNELAVTHLGFASAIDAINKTFYDFPAERETRAYTIVGVMPDQNFLGLHNKIKPFVFVIRPEVFSYASIRISGRDMKATTQEIEKVWKEVIPDYPIQTEWLDETFGSIFKIFSAMTKVLTGFAAMALTLSTIGLFGLAAFMAARRTKEIGIRKVMGANLTQIVRMLVWKLSKPVMWALVVALPVSYFASGIYLDFFADRLNQTEIIVSGAGILVVGISWAIVAVHALKVARSSPVYALRYE